MAAIDFAFSQFIVVRAALVATVAVVIVPLKSTVEIVAASPMGAACMALAETTPIKPLAPTVTPRFVKNSRRRSTARLTRFCAVSSEMPNTAPTSHRLLFSK